MLSIILVAVGGGLGAVARYLVSTWAAARLGSGFPYGTLIVNVVGCFIIGLFMSLMLERVVINPYLRLFFVVGFVGGLTTFSSFSYETLRLLEEADIMHSFANIGLNMFIGFLATWLGIAMGKLV